MNHWILGNSFLSFFFLFLYVLNMLGVYKKGPLAKNNCFKIVKSVKAAHWSLIIFLWIHLEKRLLKPISELKFWSLAYLKEEESGYGWVGQDKKDVPQIFFIYTFFFNELSHTQIFCLNNYSQFTYANTDLFDWNHLTRKWQKGN